MLVLLGLVAGLVAAMALLGGRSVVVVSPPEPMRSGGGGCLGTAATVLILVPTALAALGLLGA